MDIDQEGQEQDDYEPVAGGKFYLEHYVQNHEEYITARAVKLVEQVEWNC